MRTLLCLVSLYFIASCSNDDVVDPQLDAASYDAALGADSGEVLPDAAATSTCASGDSVDFCEIDNEICMESDLGGTLLAECQPLPVGCDETRDCAHCASLCGDLTCEDSSTDNAITCIAG